MFSSLHYFILAGNIMGLLFVPIVLIRKKHPVSAVSWCLTVVFIPYLGVLFFLVFGAFRVKRRLRKKVFHRSRFLRRWNTHKSQNGNATSLQTWANMGQFGFRVGGSPVSDGNDITLYEHGDPAFKDKFDAIRSAVHHVHLEYFVLRDDLLGRSLIRLLCEKVTQGVRVRLLVDAIGSRKAGHLLQQLHKAGGRTVLFLPSRLWSGRFTLGLRNHRKILICDGKVGFIGGLNVGDEYVSRSASFGYWRDTHMRITGPAVLALQRIFAEDWDFASEELLSGNDYFPQPSTNSRTRLQIVWSGPDQEYNTAHETYFAAITSAQKRLWISTPYLIPDGAILTALRSAALRGVDVRILTQSYPPDHWITYWAGRYFWEDFLSCGIRIFEYEKGMMHAKVLLVDGAWASVGSANLDIRSIRLNFEVNCHIHSPRAVSELEARFEKDLQDSKQISTTIFRHRPMRHHLAENLCRLFSPLL